MTQNRCVMCLKSVVATSRDVLADAQVALERMNQGADVHLATRMKTAVDADNDVQFFVCFDCTLAYKETDIRARAIRMYHLGKSGLNPDVLTEELPRDSRSDLIRLSDVFIKAKEQASTRAPWLEAYARKLEARKVVQRAESEQRANYALRSGVKPGTLNWKLEAGTLDHADVYSFSGDALQAITQASRSVPMESVLDMQTIPDACGWWWFSPALPLVTSQHFTHVDGLLWGVFGEVDNETIGTARPAPDEPSMVQIYLDDSHLRIDFSCYVVSPTGIQPSLAWSWRPGQTLDDLERVVRRQYRRTYGPMGPYNENSDVLEESQTLETVLAVTRFFIASCTWVSQEIVVTTPEHVQVHDKYRVGKHKKHVNRQQTIRVVQLRKRHRSGVAADPSMPADRKHVDWSCRWGVIGHWRHQPYGPGRTHKRLKYIFPFEKGPDDKPFKSASKKVYAVVR